MRVDTTQVYAGIRPQQVKETVAFYEEKAAQMLGSGWVRRFPGSRTLAEVLKPSIAALVLLSSE